LSPTGPGAWRSRSPKDHRPGQKNPDGGRGSRSRVPSRGRRRIRGVFAGEPEARNRGRPAPHRDENAKRVEEKLPPRHPRGPGPKCGVQGDLIDASTGKPDRKGETCFSRGQKRPCRRAPVNAAAAAVFPRLRGLARRHLRGPGVCRPCWPERRCEPACEPMLMEKWSGPNTSKVTNRPPPTAETRARAEEWPTAGFAGRGFGPGRQESKLEQFVTPSSTAASARLRAAPAIPRGRSGRHARCGPRPPTLNAAPQDGRRAGEGRRC